MIYSSRFTCVIDTCVLHPLHVRDLILWFAYSDLFVPKWSKHIFDEWRELMFRKKVPKKEINHRIDSVLNGFPDAMVTNYETHIVSLTGINKKDRHVLAAAIKINASLIVTNNLKDFPKDYLESFGLYAKSAADFLVDIIGLHDEEAIKAFRMMVVDRRNPSINEHEMLDILRNNGLKDTADYIHALI
ncbi:MAG: PIN domain-containing protein [Ekhidna sp.]|nr:PIN domain-containing protein [Ekhidna sp.]